jgi:hypothetical protein
MPAFTHRDWLPAEVRIVARYARALASGRYSTVKSASDACLADIGKLYARLLRTDPNHPVATRPRPLASVRFRLRELLGELGLDWRSRILTEPELRVINRVVHELLAGRFRGIRGAAEACKLELDRIAPDVGRSRLLPIEFVRRHIYVRARGDARTWGCVFWRPDEDAVVRKFARAVVRGEYPSAKSAVADCLRELPRRGRSAAGVRARLIMFMGTMGRVRGSRWSAAEEKECQRYARLLVQGRYHSLPAAAGACATRLAEAARKGVHHVKSHSAAGVEHHLDRELRRLAVTRYNGRTTSAERGIYEQAARALAAGEYRGCVEAARACAPDIRRLGYAGRRRGRRPSLGPGDRTLRGIEHHILAAAARLNLQWPRQDWHPEEQRAFESWLRWYRRYRTVRRLQPLTTAAEGLRDELADKGYHRTLTAIKARLGVVRRRLDGYAHR